MVSIRNPLSSVRNREPNPPPGKWLAPLVLLAVAFGSTAFAQKTPPSVKVQKTSVTTTTAPVKPFADITLTGFPDTINNATVYLENNEAGDLLAAPDSKTITAKFDRTACLLTLSGAATPADYQNLLRGVQFTPKSKLTHSRRACVTVGPGLGFKVNGENHYYEYVKDNGIDWDKAKAAAEGKKYLIVLPGYLATITSAAEQQFIQGKLGGSGWLGASDEPTEGEWRWKTGPEGKEDGGKGLLFTYGKSGGGIDQAKQATLKPTPYTNWGGREPNDNNKEHYAHFFKTGMWNDYSNHNDAIEGYLVEYGGTGQTLDVSAEVNIVPPPIRMNAYGDVHFTTPDGLMFDYQGTGDYVALQSKDRTAVIHARQTPWGTNKGVSVTTAVALSVAGDKVELQVQEGNKTVLTVNGKEAVLTQDADLPQGGRIEGTAGGNSLTVYWPKNAFMATVNLRGKFIDYGVANLGMQPSFEGLLGTLDGKADNDYLCRDGKVINAPAKDVKEINTFGDSWRIGKDDTLFTTPAPEASPHTAAVIDAERQMAAKAEVQKARIIGLVERARAAFDLGSTGEKAFLDSAAAQGEARAAMTPAEKAKFVAGDTLTQALLEEENRAISYTDAVKKTQGDWKVNWELTQKYNKPLTPQPNWDKLNASVFGLTFKKQGLTTFYNGKEKERQFQIQKKSKEKNVFAVTEVIEEEGPTITGEFELINDDLMLYEVHNIADLPFMLVLEKRK